MIDIPKPDPTTSQMAMKAYDLESSIYQVAGENQKLYDQDLNSLLSSVLKTRKIFARSYADSMPGTQQANDAIHGFLQCNAEIMRQLNIIT